MGSSLWPQGARGFDGGCRGGDICGRGDVVTTSRIGIGTCAMDGDSSLFFGGVVIFINDDDPCRCWVAVEKRIHARLLCIVLISLEGRINGRTKSNHCVAEILKSSTTGIMARSQQCFQRHQSLNNCIDITVGLSLLDNVGNDLHPESVSGGDFVHLVDEGVIVVTCLDFNAKRNGD